MRVYRVEHVAVVKTGDTPLVLFVHAVGLAASTGWTNPRLDPSGDSNPADAVLELSFEADRPDGPTLPVLSPIYATTELRPTDGADAVVVIARTNSLTVHASEFLTHVPEGAETGRQARPTTLMVGEEGPTTLLRGEEDPPTTLALGEEGPTTLLRGEEGPPTTLALGEEGPTTLLRGEEGPPTTLAFGEEGYPTTLRFGEEGGTTLLWGEEGPPTTLAFGEEGPGPFDPRGGYGPFGGY